MHAPLSVVLSRQPNCPVTLLSKYLTLWGSRPGAIFLSEDGLPVLLSVFSNQLLRVCHLCGLDPSRYKGHSFGLGAASYAADRGCSDTQIRMLGRWKSNAFLRNIRVASLSSWTNNAGHHIYWQRGSVGMGGCPTLLFLTLLISFSLIAKDSSDKWQFLPSCIPWCGCCNLVSLNCRLSLHGQLFQKLVFIFVVTDLMIRVHLPTRQTYRVHTKTCNHFSRTFQGPLTRNIICTKMHISSPF